MILFDPATGIFNHETPDNIFLIEPYVPQNSIVVLYGMPTLGKTPIGWAMCDAVQRGGKFMDIQARLGNALALEFDMPLHLVKDRWKRASPPFLPVFGAAFEQAGVDSSKLLSSTDSHHKAIREMLIEYQEMYNPSLVMVDALRKVIRGDINSPGVADMVYRAWQALFPNASILFIHHESKDRDPLIHADPLQKAKGSMEFLDIAQVGMRLEKSKNGTYLSVTKTQASAIPDPRKVTIRDGVYVS